MKEETSHFPCNHGDPSMPRSKTPKTGDSAGAGLFRRLGSLFADRQLLVQRIGAGISLALTVTVIAGLALGFRPLQARAAELRAAEPRVEFEWPPLAGKTSSRPDQPGGAPATWLNAEMRQQLESIALNHLTPDPFDDAGLASARNALAATGWFEEGQVALRRWPGGLVQIWGNWRLPVAVVRAGGRDRLIAAKGELLPPNYPPDRSGMKVIVGPRNDLPALGEPWLGGDVQAGLALLNYLHTSPGFEQVQAIDVSRFSTDKTLEIITELGNRIVWGGPVDSYSPGQAHPAVRRTRLAALFKDYGRIDTGRPKLDLRPEDSVYIHDAASAQAPASPSAPAIPNPTHAAALRSRAGSRTTAAADPR